MKKVFDMLGVGFGPSNLALAVAIDEQKNSNNISALFFEQKNEFVWHPNMLLKGTKVQISFLKDLATLRNPSSPYTFLNYLHSVGRLSSFVNLRSLYPSRIEFNDYLSWVAGRLSHYVKYGYRVKNIMPFGEEPYEFFEVECEHLSSGRIERVLARNIVVATGASPSMPAVVKARADSKRIWHTSSYLEKISPFQSQPEQAYHFAVVGGGQSAAEVACDLHTHFPNAKVTCVYRKFGYKPADDSEFINEVFNPDFVDLMYAAPDWVRQKILNDHSDTNYAVVDNDRIQKLYRIKYDESVTGQKRMQFKRLSSITAIQETEDKIKIRVEDQLTSMHENFNVDAVILATGYSYPNPPQVIEGLKDFFVKDASGNLMPNRHYRLATHASLKAGIYVQGINESTHGLTDTLLSILPLRAQEILGNIILNKEGVQEKELYEDHNLNISVLDFLTQSHHLKERSA